VKKKTLINVLIAAVVGTCFSATAETLTINKKINGIREVYYDCPGSLHVTQGDKESLKIEVSDANKDKLDIYTRDDSLYLSKKTFSSWFSADNNIHANIYLTVKNLKYFKNSSSGDTKIDPLHVENLEICNTSSGNIALATVNCENLSARVSSSGCLKAEKFNLTGDLDIDISSSGNVNIDKLICRNIEAISSSSGDFYSSLDNNAKQNSIELTISSSGNIYLYNINAQEVEADISSSGDIEVKGNTVKQEISLSSSGNYNAKSLNSKKAELSSSSSGSARINVSKKLKLITSGSGSVYLHGQPKMDLSISGSCKLITDN
jgi:hypothetical protein